MQKTAMQKVTIYRYLMQDDSNDVYHSAAVSLHSYSQTLPNIVSAGLHNYSQPVSGILKANTEVTESTARALRSLNFFCLMSTVVSKIASFTFIDITRLFILQFPCLQLAYLSTLPDFPGDARILAL